MTLDGVPEIVLQFDVEALVSTLPAESPWPVTLEGRFGDGEGFVGSTYLRGVAETDGTGGEP
jgi:hypothetical protein